MDTTPYESYREIGENWISSIPSHWDLMKVSHLAQLKSGENITSFSIKPVDDYPVFGGNGLRGYFDEYTHEGDYILIGRQGALCGNINYASGKFWASEHAVVVTPDRPLSMRWLGEVLRTMNLGQYSVSAAQPGISVDMVTKLKVPFPPIEEQQKIADFLDFKTKQIDQLIKKKKALIEKLNEQRIAVITQAVTKGIDKNVKIKPSGVDWLGDVPEHWEVVKFKYYIGFQEGPGIMAVDFRDEGVPLLRIRNVKNKNIEMEGCNFLDPEKVEKIWNHFKCQAGDLIISGSASTGLVSEVRGDAVGSIIYTGLIRLWPYNNEIEEEYIRLLVSSELFFSQIDQFKTGSTIQHFGPEHLRQMLITLPPIEEQLPIVDRVKTDSNHVDKLIKKTKSAVEKLEEYRGALITAAVTEK